jgi:hypothetical protein
MGRMAMVVLWPSFLVAILAEGFFFSVFDPADMAIGGYHLELSPLPVYTIGFFFFWIFCALASMLSCYLLQGSRAERSPF